jgi:hypothetical protein
VRSTFIHFGQADTSVRYAKTSEIGRLIVALVR